jgi:hypothetical protein
VRQRKRCPISQTCHVAPVLLIYNTISYTYITDRCHIIANDPISY